MSHQHFDETDIEFLSVPVPKRRRTESVLLHLDLFLNRDELAHMNVFLGRNAETVRLLGADDEYIEFDVAQAKKFLTTLVKNFDRVTGLVTLEAYADPRGLVGLGALAACRRNAHGARHARGRHRLVRGRTAQTH